MVLQILDSDLGTIDSVPTRLSDFIQKYVRPSKSEEFLAKETKSFSSKDGTRIINYLTFYIYLQSLVRTECMYFSKYYYWFN